jgi:hypothetical protein
MNVKDTTKKGNLEKQLRTLNERQKVADCFVTFRVNSMQLEKLKHQAQTENRTISNYIKNLIF